MGAKTKNALRNLIHVILILLALELSVIQMVVANALLVPLVIQDKSVLRVNANAMKIAQISKLVRTTIVSILVKVEPAKKIFSAKLFVMCQSVVGNMSQSHKSQEIFLLSENPTKILKNSQHQGDLHHQTLSSLEADMTVTVGKDIFLYPSSFDSKPEVYKNIFQNGLILNSTEVLRTTKNPVLSEANQQKNPQE